MGRRRQDEAERDRLASELIGRLQAGEVEAFERLYDLYATPIYAYLRLALHDWGDAEDATQDVFVKALEALPRYELGRAPFRVWLFRVARNHAINLSTKRGRSRPEDPRTLDRMLDLGPRRSPDPAGLPGGEVLMALVGRLPAPQRQALVLHHVLGFEVSEVAEIMERSENAVRLLERRAIASLRERLEARGGERELPPGRLAVASRSRESPVAAVRRLALGT